MGVSKHLEIVFAVKDTDKGIRKSVDQCNDHKLDQKCCCKGPVEKLTDEIMFALSVALADQRLCTLGKSV